MQDDGLSKLNLGCGAFKKEGYINVDVSPTMNPDVIHNLDEFPYPFHESQFDLIEADHVLEHLREPFAVMGEWHRLLKDGGRLLVRVPHFSRGFTHSDHKRGFDTSFPYYFQKSFHAGYTGIDFDLTGMRLTWFAQPYFKKTILPAPIYYGMRSIGAVIDFFANLSPFVCSRLWCYWVGGFEQIEYRFVCSK